MDFFNSRRRRSNKIRLLIGYGLMAVLVLLTTLVLLYDAYGYGFGKNGQIIQKGLVFLSSSPSPAQIYLNGTLYKSQTNSRLELPAGQYTVKLVRSGYRPWVRAVGVEGGSVERFDYPLLFPTNLVTTNVQQYSAQPGLVLQSPSRQWLLIEQPGKPDSFDEYDLNNQKQLASTLTTVSVPSNVLTASSGPESLKLVAWSTDNEHILLEHFYKGGSEYILFNRQTPADSVNLTKELKLAPGVLPAFDNNNYNQYFLFDPSAQTLSTATLSDPTPVPMLTHVLDYKSYGSNVILYVTDQNAPKGKDDVDVLQNGQSFRILPVAAGSNYLLNLTQYSGDWYVVAGAASENKVYVYENPVGDLQGQPGQPLVPVSILKVKDPNYVNFSANAQFVMAENGASVAVFDAENDKGYSYKLDTPVPAGQHANWIDGYHLAVVSAGKVIVWDYDDANQQTLQLAVDGTLPFFDQNYQWSYAVAPVTTSTTASSSSSSSADKFALTSTAMLIPSDQ